MKNKTAVYLAKQIIWFIQVLSFLSWRLVSKQIKPRLSATPSVCVYLYMYLCENQIEFQTLGERFHLWEARIWPVLTFRQTFKWLFEGSNLVLRVRL